MDSVEEELERLARLRTSGDLSDAEYELLKARLIAGDEGESALGPDEPQGASGEADLRTDAKGRLKTDAKETLSTWSAGSIWPTGGFNPVSVWRRPQNYSALLKEGASALREGNEAEVRRCRAGLRELFEVPPEPGAGEVYIRRVRKGRADSHEWSGSLYWRSKSTLIVGDDPRFSYSWRNSGGTERFNPGLSLEDVESASPTKLTYLLGQVQERLHKQVNACSPPDVGGRYLVPPTDFGPCDAMYRFYGERSRDYFLHALLLNKQMQPPAALEAWVALNARTSEWKRKRKKFFYYHLSLNNHWNIWILEFVGLLGIIVGSFLALAFIESSIQT